MFYEKHFRFKKTPHIMGVENFNEGTKYEKTTNFNLEQFYFLNDTEHQNKPIYKVIHELISNKAIKC